MTKADPITDPEIAAMDAISSALVELDQDAVARVLRWATERFVGDRIASTSASAFAAVPEEPPGRTQHFDEMADLFHAANPTTGPERVLVAAYWFQVLKGEPSVTGWQANKELKNLGRQVANVTDSFNTLMKRKPALAIQVFKSGVGKQGRKKYKLTVEGIHAVEAMLRSSHSER